MSSIEIEKTCTRCKTTKSISEYYRYSVGKHTHRPVCKQCYKDSIDPEKSREYSRRSREKQKQEREKRLEELRLERGSWF